MLPATSSAKAVLGVEVPIPTLTAFGPVPPSTKALLSETEALAPMAVALVNWVELPGPALKPTKVSLDPLTFPLDACKPGVDA